MANFSLFILFTFVGFGSNSKTESFGEPAKDVIVHTSVLWFYGFMEAIHEVFSVYGENKNM